MKLAPALAAAACLAPAALADFSDSFVFGPATDFYTANGSAAHDTYWYALTNAGGQAGSLWRNDPEPVSNGFVTTFEFEIFHPTIPGDGFAFVIHNSPDANTALGTGGGAMGYDLENSIAIEFDTFTCCGEFPGPHVAIHTLGASTNSMDNSAALAQAPLAPLGFDFLSPARHTATIQYIPSDGVDPSHLDVFVDNTFVVSAVVDLNDIDGDNITNEGNAYVGFTAGTGLADSHHLIHSWHFASNTDQCKEPTWHLMSWGGAGLGFFMQASWMVNATQPMTFEWYRNNVLITDDDAGRLTGIDSYNLVINDFQLSDIDYYRGVATNACGSTTSIEVFLGICLADVDDGSASGTRDGGVTIDDLIYYLSVFDLGDPAADIDDGNGFGFRDGGVTIDDLILFLTRFDSGC